MFAVLTTFVNTLADDKEYTKAQLLEIIENDPKYKEMKQKENKEKCHYVFTKGKRSGEKCKSKVSLHSETGKYCAKHAKRVENAESDSEPGNTCDWEMTRGKKKGEKCGRRCSKSSTEYCTTHLKNAEKKSSDEDKPPPLEDDTPGCVHIKTGGKNKGNPCGKKVEDGQDLCKKHSKKEGKKESKNSIYRPIRNSEYYKSKIDDIMMAFVKKDDNEVEAYSIFQDGKHKPLTEAAREVLKSHNINVCEQPFIKEEVQQLKEEPEIELE